MSWGQETAAGPRNMLDVEPLDTIDSFAGAALCINHLTGWRNGSASDSSPEGYEFESHTVHHTPSTLTHTP